MDGWTYTKIGNQDRKYSRYQTCTPVHPAGWKRQAGYYRNRYQQSRQEQMVRQRYAQTGSSCWRAWAWTCGHRHSAEFWSSNDGAAISRYCFTQTWICLGSFCMHSISVLLFWWCSPHPSFRIFNPRLLLKYKNSICLQRICASLCSWQRNIYARLVNYSLQVEQRFIIN